MGKHFVAAESSVGIQNNTNQSLVIKADYRTYSVLVVQQTFLRYL